MRDHAVRTGEDAWRRGVVHVYAVIVIESEYQPAERIAASAPLHNGIVGAEEHLTRHVLGFYNLAGAALTHEVVVTIEIGMVAYMMHNARLDDALRDYPLGVEIHSLYLAVEQWCLRLKRSYRHLHHEAFVAVVGIEMQSRHINNHILLVQLRIIAVVLPTATLHIAEQQSAISLVVSLVEFVYVFVVQWVMRLRFGKKVGKLLAIALYHAASRGKIVAARQTGIPAVQRSVGHMNGVVVALVESVKSLERIHETETLSFGIAQESLCKVILQTGEHFIGCIS